MMQVQEVRRWLENFNADDDVGITDDGLTLQILQNSTAYLEVGGMPEDTEDE